MIENEPPFQNAVLLHVQHFCWNNMDLMQCASGASRDVFSFEQKSLQHVTAVGHVHASLCETFLWPFKIHMHSPLVVEPSSLRIQIAPALRICTGVCGKVGRPKALIYTSAKTWTSSIICCSSPSPLLALGTSWIGRAWTEGSFCTGNDCSPPMITAKKWALAGRCP